jgi:outer membrane protein TolC
VRLLVATEIAMARFEDLALGEEISVHTRQLASEQKNVAMNQALFQQGLISTSAQAAGVADMEEARRTLSELERQRGLTRLRLTRLCGGAAGDTPHSSMPRIPQSPAKAPASVWGSRPDLIAAEADVRSAFATADAARLDLLPSLSLAAGGNLGSNSLTGQLRTWELSAGPRLEIPLWDPARIAATKRGNAKAAETAANYRSTALSAVEEIEGAYLNFQRRKSQLASAETEMESARTAWLHAQSLTSEGQGSFAQENQAARRYRDATRNTTRLRLHTLNDHLTLIRALGG